MTRLRAIPDMAIDKGDPRVLTLFEAADEIERLRAELKEALGE